MSRAANLTRAVAQHRSATTTLVRQSIHLDLSNAQDRDALTFEATSTFTLVSTQDAVEIDVVAASAPAVEVDGHAASSSYADSRVRVEGLTPGVEHTVVVRAQSLFSHTGEGLHRYFDPQDGETYLYSHFEPTDARRVFPCFDQPDMKTSFTVSVVAPKHWLVRSNAPAESTTTVPTGSAVECAMTVFAPTKTQASYIICVAAGPYTLIEDTFTTDDGRVIDLAVMCRPTMRPHLPLEDVLRWTKAGLPWCEEKLGTPYPWGKYDQIFVPEYNIGAMENPGLVTFNENYLKRGDATANERERLANTLLHEMAHMWFGDLVTMPWWDDLWLKESFADFIGTQAASEVTEFSDSWLTFGLGRKAWAYAADALPSTHPIVADIPDVEAARANFDGITYAKGASVLRQLVAYVGEEAFYAGAKAYFAKHAFGNARLADLLTELSTTSGRDMSAWATAWLQSAGTDVISVVTGESGTSGVTLRRTSVNALDGTSANRPHRITVTSFAVSDAGWAPQASHTVDLADEVTTVELPAGAILVDDGNWTFAKIRPDAATVKAMLANVAALAEPERRALVWGQLWELVRDAQLPADVYLSAIGSQLPGETNPSIIDAVTTTALTAITTYLPEASRAQAGDALWQVVVAAHAQALEHNDEAARDVALAWRKAVIAAAAVAPSAADEVLALLDGSGALHPDDDERWSLIISLTAHGSHPQAAARLLDAQAARDTTSRGKAQQIAVAAAAPTRAAKDGAWAQTDTTTLTNEEVISLVAGLTHPASVALARQFEQSYLDHLATWWAERSQVIATRLARGLFAVVGSMSDAEGWLAAHEDAPAALRRIVIEEVATLQRALRAQALVTAER